MNITLKNTIPEKIKIMVVYAPWHGIWGDAILKDLSSRNFQVNRLQTKILPYFWALKSQSILIRYFKAIYFWTYCFLDSSKLIIKCIFFRPNLIFLLKAESITQTGLKICKKINPSKFISWWVDDPKFIPIRNIKKYWENFDLLYNFDKKIVEELNSKFNPVNFKYLPLAGSPSDHYLKYEKKINQRDRKLIFIGSDFDSRVEFLNKLKVSKKIFGDGWFKRNLNNSEVHENLDPILAKNYYQNNLICLNIHAEQSKVSPNTRFFEIFLAGGLQFVEKLPGIVEILGDEYPFYFSSIEELNIKISNLLNLSEDQLSKFDDLIKKIQEKIISNHTYGFRITEILKDIF